MTEKKHPKNYIKELRKQRNMTAAQLAEKINKAAPFITMLENGKRGLTWTTLRDIADALDVSPLEITEGLNKLQDTTQNNKEKELLQIFRSLDNSAKAMYLHTLRSFQKEIKVATVRNFYRSGKLRTNNDGRNTAAPSEPVTKKAVL